MKTAKVFKNGRSQAIRLPKEFPVKGAEVYLQKVPGGILITERDPWELFEEGCQELSPDFMKDGRKPLPEKKRVDCFRIRYRAN